jgi:hypothetical protein
MLIRYLIIITVLNLSLTTTLNLLGDYSIILLKSNTAGFSVVVYSLEVVIVLPAAAIVLLCLQRAQLIS